MPAERHAELVFSIVVTARKPQSKPLSRTLEEPAQVMTHSR